MKKTDPYDVDMESIADKLEKIIPPQVTAKLKRIAYEITIGLSEEEACLIADYPFEKFIELKKNEPLVDRLIQMKQLSFERDIVKNLAHEAKTDKKVGQWLLENRNPDKWNKKKGQGDQGEAGSLLLAAFKFVQQADEAPIEQRARKYVELDKVSGVTLDDILS